MNPLYSNFMLNTSSGYESASNDSSLNESYAIIRNEQQSMLIKDYQININNKSIYNDKSNYRSTKRRILSHLQREEANRRERQRMEIINQAYENLRNVLPFKKGRKRQKMSRIDTVDGAIRYIQSLLNTLNECNENMDF